MNFQKDIKNRKTFAIISHPDAGKTTLTEKFLLYGGALHLAGAVKARKNQRATTSDWMELEKKRGISVSSTVLQFDYKEFHINLLDTPGHRDFSEDTYRVLTAVDSAVMVIDAAKGIEAQTRKLFEVCRQRGIPIFTFINKMDHPTRDPLELLDEIEKVLNLKVYPMNWPLGTGSDFKGVYDPRHKEAHFYEKTIGGAYEAPVSVHEFSDPSVKDHLEDWIYDKVSEELEMLDMAGTPFDAGSVLKGETTPVYFGSALNNFGIQLMLEGFIGYAPEPVPRKSKELIVPIDSEKFSAFIFKIQGNMDPRHRDRIAFLRVCSGKFERDKIVIHSNTGKKIRLTNSHKLFGQDREIVNEAYAGDVVGLVGHPDFQIGDTLTEDPSIIFDEVPRFPPECFSFLQNPNTAKYKSFRKGLEQFVKEGIVRSFTLKNSGNTTPLLAAVGPLQFEVVQYRMETEYNTKARLEGAKWQLARWVSPEIDAKKVDDVILPNGVALVEDQDSQLALLFPNEWSVQYFEKRYPEIPLRVLPGAMVESELKL